MDAVAIAGGQHANQGRALGDKRGVVADSFARGNAAQIDDFRAQAHHRLQRQQLLRLFALFRGIVAGMVAVQNRAGAHHVRPGFRARDNGCAVGKMHQAGIDAQRAQPVQCRVEALFLFAGLLANGGIHKNSRRREVGKSAGELQVLALAKLPRETLDIRGGDAQAIHSGVNFQVERGALAASAASCGAFEQRQLVAAMNDGGEVVPEQASFFAGHEARQHQNGLAHAGFAYGDSFVGAGDAKPVRSGFFERLGHLRSAVAVTIAFDDGQNFPRRLAFLFRRVHVLANGFEVVRQRSERNFRPYRPFCFVTRCSTAGTFLFAWHVP